jgi:hypothetical protein
MNAKRDSELARIRETKMRISEQFNHDLELIVKHCMELQKRHHDRLVYSAQTRERDRPLEMP